MDSIITQTLKGKTIRDLEPLIGGQETRAANKRHDLEYGFDQRAIANGYEKMRWPVYVPAYPRLVRRVTSDDEIWQWHRQWEAARAMPGTLKTA